MQHFVGIAEIKISQDPQDILVAPNLGSCVGVSVYDPRLKKGGMIHCLLPLSSSDPEKAQAKPIMYVDTGLAALLDQFLTQGSQKKELIICVAGGANINDTKNVFEIGKKNYTILKKLLWKNNLLLKAEHIGDSISRTIALDIGTGKVTLKAQGETTDLT